MPTLMDHLLVYNYLSQMERSNAKFSKKEDLIWYLMFISGVIVVGHFALVQSRLQRLVFILSQLSLIYLPA